MTSNQIKQEKTIQYSQSTIKRAEQAFFCSPFQLNLFTIMSSTSVPLPLIAGQTGIEESYTLNSLSEGHVERELMWLIQVGLLRREVDGQGITDSFRLTPLGRQLIEKWKHQKGYFPTPSWLDRIDNTLNRWFKLFI